MSSLTLAVALFASAASPRAFPSAQQFQQYNGCHLKTPGTCTAENYQSVTCTDFCGVGDHPIQYVPIGSGNKRVHVAFSTIANGSDRVNNVTMWVLELACSQGADILIFGTGYGCRNNFEFGPDTDAANVHHIIRQCIGLAGNVKLAFVAPHGHADHINPEFVHALLNAGNYTLGKIYVHADDMTAAQGISTDPDCSESEWTAAELDPATGNFVSFGVMDGCHPVDPSNRCQQHWNDAGVKSFDTTVGKVWFQSRDGHTPGAVDLVIDYMGDEAERYVLYGSATPCVIVGNNCYVNPNGVKRTPKCTLPGVVWAIDAHGDITPDPIPSQNCP